MICTKFEIGLLILEKIIFNINKTEYGFPYGGLFPTPWRDHDSKKFESTLYQRAFMYKYDLFWLNGSGEDPHPIFEFL
jgi:hypothetical protein